MDVHHYMGLVKYFALRGRGAALTALVAVVAAIATGLVYHHIGGSGNSDAPAAAAGLTKKGPYDGYYLDSGFRQAGSDPHRHRRAAVQPGPTHRGQGGAAVLRLHPLP